MENKIKLKFAIAYDNLYDIKSKLNNRFSSQIDLFLNQMEEEVKTWDYEFKLNHKSQKFKLYKIK